MRSAATASSSTPTSQRTTPDTRVRVDGTFTDVGAHASHTVRVDWGDRSTPELLVIPQGARTFTHTHRYRDELRTGVKVELMDDHGAKAHRDAPITVTNVAPGGIDLDVVKTITETGEVRGRDVVEGAPVAYEVKYLDPGQDDRGEITINWGDGTPAQRIATAAGQTKAEVRHRYERDGEFRATVTVRDEDKDEATVTEGVRVLNAPPVLNTALAQATIKPGAVARVAGTITDPGVADTHTVSIDWGTAVPAAERKQTIALAPGRADVPGREADRGRRDLLGQGRGRRRRRARARERQAPADRHAVARSESLGATFVSRSGLTALRSGR